MPRALFALALLFTIAWTSQIFAQAEGTPPLRPTGPFEFETVEDAWQAAHESRVPVLLFVTSDHCYYCKKMITQTMSHPQLAPVFARLFETALIDASRQPEVVKKLGVRAFPTTLVLSPEGQLLGKIEGFIRPDEIGNQLNPILIAYRKSEASRTGQVANR